MNCHNGINDCQSGINILATRIFDNVRMDLDRQSFNVEACSLPTGITALYLSGTGVLTPDSNITVVPNLNDSFATVSGTLYLPGTLTYIYQGAKATARANLLIPINILMTLPEDSIWPFDITVHYSYFADNLEETGTNTFSSLTDGVIITYVTACMPVNLKDNCPIYYNSISERAVLNQSTFLNADFYPNIKGPSV